MSLIAKDLIDAGMHAGSCEIVCSLAYSDGADGQYSTQCWFYGK